MGVLFGGLSKGYLTFGSVDRNTVILKLFLHQKSPVNSYATKCRKPLMVKEPQKCLVYYKSVLNVNPQDMCISDKVRLIL